MAMRACRALASGRINQTSSETNAKTPANNTSEISAQIE
jgi:hypothetical protein